MQPDSAAFADAATARLCFASCVRAGEAGRPGDKGRCLSDKSLCLWELLSRLGSLGRLSLMLGHAVQERLQRPMHTRAQRSKVQDPSAPLPSLIFIPCLPKLLLMESSMSIIFFLSAPAGDDRVSALSWLRNKTTSSIIWETPASLAGEDLEVYTIKREAKNSSTL